MKRLLLIAALLALPVTLLAQYPLVRAFEVRPGQQRPRVDRIAQDSRGLIWAASDAGLLRTDGETVEVMARFENERIAAIGADGPGVVIAVSSGALLRCGDARCDTLLIDSLLSGARVSAIARRHDGTLYIGTHGSGLWCWQAGAAQRFDSRSGMPDDHVNDLALLDDGAVVVATDQGLAVCDGRRITGRMGESEGAPDNLVHSVAVDEQGLVWAGTDRSGVFNWRMGAAPKAVAQPWEFGAIRHLAVGGGYLWAATALHGPVVVDLALEHGTYRPDSTLRKEPLDLLLDRDGAVWWSDGTEALHRADPAFLFVPDHEGLDLRGITALCADGRQSIWFATRSGIYRHVAWFSEERKVTRLPVELDPRTPVVSLASAPDGTIWAATFGAGAIAISPDGHARLITETDGLPNNNVLSVRSTKDGVVLSTLSGIAFVDAEGVHAAASDAGFAFDALTCGASTLIATDGKGIRALDAGSSASRELRTGTYYSILHADDGRCWAIGPGTGFCAANGDVACVGAQLPPFDGDVYALGESAGRLLAFGSTGVLAFEPGTGNTMDVTGTFGMAGATAELNALAKDHAQALWLACSKGLVRLRPHEAHFRQRLEAALLVVQVAGEGMPHAGGIRASHDRSALTLHFTATHWSDPQAVRFQYRLLGFSDRVIDTRDREAAFPELGPGQYTFQLRAYVGAPQPDAPWTSLLITVDPPWWRQPWVMVGMVLLAVIIAVLIVRARDRRLRFRDRMEQERVRFQLEALRSQVDPHFLFNSFNALVELIETDSARAVEHVEQLSTFFRNVLQVRDRERITLSEELKLLENYFALEQRRFGDAIGLELAVDEACLSRGVVPLTLQLLVENALKHNVVVGGARFLIRVSAIDDALVVSNAIRPRATPPRSTGFGLEAITKRYAALTDRPIIVSREGGVFEVRVPLIDSEP